MTISFFSNFLNHHQLPLCLEFIKQIGSDNFVFVACEPIHQERIQMGYEDMNAKYPFVLRAYESKQYYQNAVKLAEESDVAIIGSADSLFTQIRAKKNKLTFIFAERIFKNGFWHVFYPPTAWKIYKSYTQYRNKNFYILCASAFAAHDFSMCGFPIKKCLKWGYFPEFKPYNYSKPKSDKIRIMWCGRMLWWKHPEHAIEVAKILKSRRIPFELLMVGEGEMVNTIVRMIKRYHLESEVTLKGFMSPIDIREQMLHSHLYLFTSGKQEGWGVVLSEAINSQCAIIANINAGSTKFLLNASNAFLYDGTIKNLNDVVNTISQSDMSKYASMAYEYLEKNWTPQKAVNNLLSFINNEIIPNGPCSFV